MLGSGKSVPVLVMAGGASASNVDGGAGIKRRATGSRNAGGSIAGWGGSSEDASLRKQWARPTPVSTTDRTIASFLTTGSFARYGTWRVLRVAERLVGNSPVPLSAAQAL